MDRFTKHANGKTCCTSFMNDECQRLSGHCCECSVNDKAWDKLAEYEDAAEQAAENPALTLEQLKQMDGKPVYIIHPYDHRYDHWAVVVIKVKFFPDKPWIFKDYGSLWVAYIREPAPH